MKIALNQIEEHARRYFAGHPCTVMAWATGPTPRHFPEARILAFEPGPRAQCHVFVSVGASRVRAGLHREFVLCAPKFDSCHVETVTMMLFLHHTHGLDVGHTVPIGRPWCPDATCDHLLVSLPYPFGPELENLEVGGHAVQLLWLLPVFESEVRFRHAHDLEALESLFEAQGMDYLAIRRGPAA